MFKFLVLLLSLSVFANTQNEQLYLLSSHHPHDTEMVKPYIKTIKDMGRLVVVKIVKPMPKRVLSHLDHILRPIKLSELKTYEVNKSILKKSVIPFKQDVKKILEDIKPEEVKAIVEKLSSFEVRSAGTEDNYLATQWIKSEMERLNFQTELDCFRTKYCNVYATKNSTHKMAKTILVEAHLDSVGRSFAGSDDNASGIAGLLMMARQISRLNTQDNFIFFATNGEERGLLGAKHYVRKLKSQRRLGDFKFVINMDMIGYNENGKVDLETNQEFEHEALFMADLVHKYTNLTPNITMPAWGSDHVPFLNEKIPTVLTIEHWKTKTPCYHARCDKPESLNYDYAAEIIKLNMATLLHKTETYL